MNCKPAYLYLVILVLLVFAGIYVLPLGIRPLFIPDETRYAEVPREMLVSGDWIVPHLNGLRYFEKPVMGYWAIALSQSLLGFNNFSVRLPMALAAGLTAVTIMFLVRFATSQNRDKRMDDKASQYSAPLAALIYLSCIGVAVIANIAVLDNLLVSFLTACLAALFMASEATSSSRRESGLLVIAGIACGCAFMTKGFLAFAVPALVMAPYLAWQKRGKDLLRMAWLPLVTSVIVVLPWALMIHAREPDFWRFFFWHEHVRRFFSQRAQHAHPLWFYALYFPLLALPWLLVIPAAISGLRQRENNRIARLSRFCICWFGFPFMFYSLCRGKLVTYILPCFAPFAMLMSLGLMRMPDPRNNRQLNRGITGFALLVSLLSIGLVITQLFLPPILRPYQVTWKWISVVATGIATTLLLWRAIRTQCRLRKIVMLALAPAMFLAPANYLIPQSALVAKSPGALLLDSIAKHDLRPEDAIILSGKKPIRAVCWYLRRNDVIQVGYGGELKYGLGQANAGNRRLRPEELGRKIMENSGKVILVARWKRYQQWREFLPRPRAVYSAGNRDFVVAFY